MLFVVSAPSGAGKTTIVNEVTRRNPEIIFSISATTRKGRGKEVDGKDYFFISTEDFQEKIKNNELVEYEKVYGGHYYGTLKSFIDESLKNDRDVIFDVDVNGAISIKKLYNDAAILVFIMPPDIDTLKDRLINRATESVTEIKERIDKYNYELSKAEYFDKVVINDDLKKAVSQVEEIIKESKLKNKENI